MSVIVRVFAAQSDVGDSYGSAFLVMDLRIINVSVEGLI
jgi:hypothetical protein